MQAYTLSVTTRVLVCKQAPVVSLRPIAIAEGVMGELGSAGVTPIIECLSEVVGYVFLGATCLFVT